MHSASSCLASVAARSPSCVKHRSGWPKRRRPMKRSFVTMLATLVVAVVALVPPSYAAARESVSIELAKKASLRDGGQVVVVNVRVACPARYDVLEAFMYMVQDEN